MSGIPHIIFVDSLKSRDEVCVIGNRSDSPMNQKPRYVFIGNIILRLNLKEYFTRYSKQVDGMIAFLCPEKS